VQSAGKQNYVLSRQVPSRILYVSLRWVDLQRRARGRAVNSRTDSTVRLDPRWRGQPLDPTSVPLLLSAWHIAQHDVNRSTPKYIVRARHPALLGFDEIHGNWRRAIKCLARNQFAEKYTGGPWLINIYGVLRRPYILYKNYRRIKHV